MDGLRFACQQGCTQCCEQEGFVYLTEADLGNAAGFVGLSPAEFEARYVYRTRNRMRLRKPRGRQCPFLGDSGCSIHPVKPVQCRLFPFWPELVSSKKAWNQVGRWCPGIGAGELIQIEEARQTASEMEKAYPALYHGVKPPPTPLPEGSPRSPARWPGHDLHLPEES